MLRSKPIDTEDKIDATILKKYKNTQLWFT